MPSFIGAGWRAVRSVPRIARRRGYECGGGDATGLALRPWRASAGRSGRAAAHDQSCRERPVESGGRLLAHVLAELVQDGLDHAPALVDRVLLDRGEAVENDQSGIAFALHGGLALVGPDDPGKVAVVVRMVVVGAVGLGTYALLAAALRIPELPSIVGVMADLLRRPRRA